MLNGKTIDLNYITQKVEERYVLLLNADKFYGLTKEEKKVLDIPIIQWRNNTPYGAAFMNHWFEGSGDSIALTDQNKVELLETSSVFNNHYNMFSNEIGKDQTLTLLKTQSEFDNLCNEIKNSNKTNILITRPVEYERKSEDDIPLNFLAYHNITELDNIGHLDQDFVNALGSVSIRLYYEGDMQIYADRGEAVVYNANYYWRIIDFFNFTGNQPLGTWNGTVFSPKVPVAGIEIRNTHFVSLYQKLNNAIPSSKADEKPNFQIFSKLQPIFNYPYKLTINTNDKTFKINK